MTLVDVRSMYPTLLRDELYPIQFRGWRKDMKPRELNELADFMGVIARVTLHTERGEYPLRIGDRVSYPVGTFTTTLAGPELIALRQHGEVLQCHQCSLYSLGRPFRRAVDVLLAERARAASAGNASAEGHAKLLANSLSGKLAQRSGAWRREAEGDCPGEWGEQWEANLVTGGMIRRRYIAGICWRWTDDETGAGPYTSAYAYMTAYGRVRMARLRATCPERSVVSQDTDGLWVLPDALEALLSLPELFSGSPGSLRVVKQVDDAQFLGPRHYRAGDQWTLAGYRNPTVLADGKTVYDVQAAPMWGSKEREAPTTIRTVTRSGVLKLVPPDGQLGEDGWVEPRLIRAAA